MHERASAVVSSSAPAAAAAERQRGASWDGWRWRPPRLKAMY